MKKASPRTNRRMNTKGRTGMKARRTEYYKKFRGGKNRVNRGA